MFFHYNSEDVDLSSYSDRYMSDYQFENLLVGFRHKKVKQILLEIQSTLDQCRVLEVGIGANLLVNAVSLNDSFSWSIVEPDKNFLNLVPKQKHITTHQEFFENCGNVKAYRGRYEIIILSCILHEVDFRDMIKETARNLAPNGFVLVVNPNVNSLHRQIALAAGIISKLDDKSDRSKFLGQTEMISDTMLINEFLNYSLQLKNMTGNFVKPFTHKQMERVFSWEEFNDIIDGLDNLSSELVELCCEKIFVFNNRIIT